jgi:hypothetical protein
VLEDAGHANMLTILTDPTVTTLCVLVVYGAAALLAWRRATDFARLGIARFERMGLVTCLLLLLLALSYQIEFIPETIARIKAMAKSQGWYIYRWPLAAFGLGIGFVGLGFLLFHYRPSFRRQPLSRWLMVAGGALLAGYFLLRATSIHWVDPWIGVHFGCPRTNPWFQVLGALLISLGFRVAPKCDASSQGFLAASARNH